MLTTALLAMASIPAHEAYVTQDYQLHSRAPQRRRPHGHTRPNKRSARAARSLDNEKSDNKRVQPGLLYRSRHLKADLEQWREAYPVDKAMRDARLAGSYYTVIDCAAGIGMSSYSTLRAGGMRHTAFTEIDPNKSLMVEALTGASGLGDHWKVNFEEIKKTLPPTNVFVSGMPCTDYSRAGSMKGMAGITGSMFVRQAETILILEPDIFCLEQSDAILETNNDALQQLRNALSTKYLKPSDHFFQKLHATWDSQLMNYLASPPLGRLDQVLIE